MNDNIMKGERKIARKLREWYPGAIYHLMHRGVRRTEIFSDETDYQVFLEILKVALDNRTLAYFKDNSILRYRDFVEDIGHKYVVQEHEIKKSMEELPFD